MNGSKYGDRYAVIENSYPCVFGIVLCGVYSKLDVQIINGINELLNSMISFASIVVGFLGVLLALLFSLGSSPIVRKIFEDGFYKRRLKKYFKVAIISGFILVMSSTFFIVKINVNDYNLLLINKFLKFVLIFCIAYFPLASYRVFSIILKISFGSNDESDEDYPEYEFTEKELQKVQKKHDKGD